MYPLSQERTSKLYKSIFEYIDQLGSLEEENIEEGNEEQEKNNAEAFTLFQRKLERLAKSKSFKKGNENDDYSTVLHKAITVFEFSKMEKNGANGCVQERGHECAHKTTQELVLEYIITAYPELVKSNRDNSKKFRGQTPLHMAICKENIELVKQLLGTARKRKKPEDDTSKDEVVREMLSQTATGLKFKNNVMMGQFPLSIAALTGNEEIVKYLLEQKETDVYQETGDGDNLCHSLLKYANIFPDREDDALKMMEFIKKEKKDCCKRLLSTPNKNDETPLILAARYGQVELVKFIIDEVKRLQRV